MRSVRGGRIPTTLLGRRDTAAWQCRQVEAGSGGLLGVVPVRWVGRVSGLGWVSGGAVWLGRLVGRAGARR